MGLRTAALVSGMALALVALAPGAGVRAGELRETATALFRPLPKAAPRLPLNPATPEKVALGRMLFFEPRLSRSHAISCHSCHNLGLGGTDMRETSLGHRSQSGARNAPTVLNAVFNSAQFWDGRARDLQEQAAGPLENPVEMAGSPDEVMVQLAGIPGYVPAFAAAYPGEAQPLTFANVRKALAVFEATLITPDAPFDRYLRGDDDALTPEQKDGLRAFVDKGCVVCHGGINLGGDQYQPFGVVERPGAALLPPADTGRFAVTRSVADEYVFKVPTLRNIELTPPYFHTGRAWDLRQAVGVMGAAQLGIALDDREVDAITAFLRSLTGRQPQVTVPILPPSAATTPRPESP